MANTAADASGLTALGESVNAALLASGADYRLAQAEWIGGDRAGQTLFFADVGNKRLGADFVPGDPRRGGRTNITYIVDQTEGAIDGLTVAQTTAAIDRAMATWNNLECSTLPIANLAAQPGDIGLVEFLIGQGGSPFFFADLHHAGWVSAAVFDFLFGPEVGPSVIAVTFTFNFVTGDDQFTDVDNNGLPDVAFREILYNDRFVWRVNGNVDVETIALHEAGHGLSQGHFGAAFVTTSNNKLHFSPRAVMNAAYSGVQQQLAGTDEAGHCANWANWPNN